MSLQDITSQMAERVAKSGGIKKTVKFDFGADGLVRIDGPVVDNQNLPVDCTVKVAMADFLEIASGKQNPQMAFMMGKLKVEGDMSVAMQLGSILG